MKGSLTGAISTAPGIDVPTQYADESAYYRHTVDFTASVLAGSRCLMCNGLFSDHTWMASVGGVETDCSEVAR
ncbi:hypothetical protein AB0B94_31055 [Micromonospora sp. NPDC048986]|uniref:hypothetical protein n=1 Tax=Micromonospora sp. NPDC048986 TaxID=3155644 RepID=UPI003408CF85